MKLNDTHLSNPQVQEEITKEVRKHLELRVDKNHNMTKLWLSSKAVFKQKFIGLYADLRKEWKPQVNTLNST